MLQTEFPFRLPCGYVDAHGALHREGVMRRAVARDEIEPLSDPRVRANEGYFSVLLLSRVVSRIGQIRPVDPAVIEGLFATDFEYLQDLYSQINGQAGGEVETQCPRCGTRFLIDISNVDEPA